MGRCDFTGSAMAQIQSSSLVNCTLLAVLCGKVTDKQQKPPGLVPEVKRPRLSYPFPELISSGRLEVSRLLLFTVVMHFFCCVMNRLGMQVHTLINPTVDQFRKAQQAVQPNLMYLQGQQLENEEEIGTLVWGDADVSDPQIFSSLISPPFPTIVSTKLLASNNVGQRS